MSPCTSRGCRGEARGDRSPSGCSCSGDSVRILSVAMTKGVTLEKEFFLFSLHLFKSPQPGTWKGQEWGRPPTSGMGTGRGCVPLPLSQLWGL